MTNTNSDQLTTFVDALPAVSAPVKPGLVKGLSYLLGGLGNYLGAWLRRPTQSIEDRTDARSLITRAVAQAAAQKMSDDPNVVAAAIASWGPADLNRQANRMRIAKATVEEFAAQKDSEGDSAATGEVPDDDFLNSFERFASDVSDEKMQRLWATLLAGEIRRPRSYSRQAMRCLYELDSATAELFDMVARKTVGNVLQGDEERGITTNDLNKLQSAGLITGGGGVYNYKFKFQENGTCLIRAKSHLLILKKKEQGKDLSITSYPLSEAGIQLLSLIKDYDEGQSIRELADLIPDTTASDIVLCPFAEVDGKMVFDKAEVLRGHEFSIS